MNPNELVASYQQEVEAIAQKAEEAKQKIKELSGTLTSNDGAVTVTVNAAGALQKLTFGARAEEMPRAQLASAILATARRAQAQAAAQVTGILAPLVGDNSAAMKFVQEQIPTPEEPVDGPGASEPQPKRPRIAYNEEQHDAYQVSQPPPAVRRSRRPDYDDDYPASPVAREDDW